MGEDMPVRERGLCEEIRALKEFNVPEHIIDRLLCKLAEQAEKEEMRQRNMTEEITRLHIQKSNLISVLNATGYYLSLHENIIREG